MGLSHPVAAFYQLRPGRVAPGTLVELHLMMTLAAGPLTPAVPEIGMIQNPLKSIPFVFLALFCSLFSVICQR
jgi:hypothetical protein